MGQLDDETVVRAVGDGVYASRLSGAWNIGDTPNGGYAMAPALRALVDASGRPDPVSVTVHYLRPAVPDTDVTVTTHIVRAGRSATYASAVLTQDGVDRLTVAAVLADLSTAAEGPVFTLPAPAVPPPEECIDRTHLEQGVELALLSRVDVRVQRAAGADATIDGWARQRDGTPATSVTLPVLADVFPPALLATIGAIGWVPTLELTVHVRRRPQPGWVQAHIVCDDLAGDLMVETGTLWDASGALVARSRQLGMLLRR